MKKILVPVFLSAVIFTSCGKSSMDMQAPSKVDQLLTQMKSEPKFLEFLKLDNATLSIISKNLANTAPADSTIIRDKSKNFDDKYKALGWTGIDEMKANTKKSDAIIVYLHKTYPLYSQLSNDESKLFYKKAIAYYFHTKKISTL